MSIIPIMNYAISFFKDKPINVLEVGARYGESSQIILKYLNIKEYIIVDPYTSYDEYSGDGFNGILKNTEDDKIFNETKKKLTTINKNIIFNRTFSNNKNTLSKIKDKSIDFIFIDGNHTYKYVLEDLENYYPKLKDNGILCGDDFFMRHRKNDILNTMPGNAGYDENMVYEAVLEFTKKYNKNYKEFGKHRGYGKIFMII